MWGVLHCLMLQQLTDGSVTLRIYAGDVFGTKDVQYKSIIAHPDTSTDEVRIWLGWRGRSSHAGDSSGAASLQRPKRARGNG